jgi:hypothetical protein
MDVSDCDKSFTLKMKNSFCLAEFVFRDATVLAVVKGSDFGYVQSHCCFVAVTERRENCQRRAIGETVTVITQF